MESKVIYKCDPEKNTQCKKSSCKYNPNSNDKCCEHTVHKEYSIDGVPIKDTELFDWREHYE